VYDPSHPKANSNYPKAYSRDTVDPASGDFFLTNTDLLIPRRGIPPASRGANTFTCDHENRLTQAVIGGARSTYTYNGDSLRMSRTVGGATTSYTWDVAASMPVVLQDGTNTYICGLGLMSATDGSEVQSYYLSDGLGSTTNLADGRANRVTSYTLSALYKITRET
jgi:hypothetical protein